jgi:predicted DNA-binding transcriptional regulator YafY
VRLGYSDRTRATTERIIHPLGLVEKGSVWYLVADTEAGLRTFRVGRVRSVEVTGDPVRRPEGFDLATAWQEVVETIEERRTVVRTTVRAPGWAVYGLRAQLGTAVSVVAEHDDGGVDVEIGTPSTHVIAQQLAGWGRMIEVLAPDEVRQQLAATGAELVELYRAS